eukprot:UN32745
MKKKLIESQTLEANLSEVTKLLNSKSTEIKTLQKKIFTLEKEKIEQQNRITELENEIIIKERRDPLISPHNVHNPLWEQYHYNSRRTSKKSHINGGHNSVSHHDPHTLDSNTHNQYEITKVMTDNRILRRGSEDEQDIIKSMSAPPDKEKLAKVQKWFKKIEALSNKSDSERGIDSPRQYSTNRHSMASTNKNSLTESPRFNKNSTNNSPRYSAGARFSDNFIPSNFNNIDSPRKKKEVNPS